MRRKLGLMIGVALAALVVLLLGRVTLSQESDLPPGGEPAPAAHSSAAVQGEAENPPSSAEQSNEPIPEEGKSLGPDARRSSDPIPASEESPGPAGSPAPPAVEEEVAAPAQTLTWLRVAGSALRPRDSDVEWLTNSSGGCAYAISGDIWTVWNTPIYLPQGATVKRLRMYWDDTNASVDCFGWFTVYDHQGEIVDEWRTESFGSGGFGWTTTEDFTHTIDYNFYSYVVNWRPYELGEDMQLCGFRIYYEPPPGAVFLPAVRRDDQDEMALLIRQVRPDDAEAILHIGTAHRQARIGESLVDKIWVERFL